MKSLSATCLLIAVSLVLCLLAFQPMFPEGYIPRSWWMPKFQEVFYAREIAAFERIDFNSDGEVNFYEIFSTLRQDYRDKGCSRDWFETAFSSFDEHARNGKLDRTDFIAFWIDFSYKMKAD